jgi:hypothetical protein
MNNVGWLGRVLLFGFLWIFLVVCSYLLLDTLGIWRNLPVGLTHAVNVATGLVLLGELVGHLVLVSGRLPDRPAAN